VLRNRLSRSYHRSAGAQPRRTTESHR